MKGITSLVGSGMAIVAIWISYGFGVHHTANKYQYQLSMLEYQLIKERETTYAWEVVSKTKSEIALKALDDLDVCNSMLPVERRLNQP